MNTRLTTYRIRKHAVPAVTRRLAAKSSLATCVMTGALGVMLTFGAWVGVAVAHEPHECPDGVGGGPAMPGHIEHSEIVETWDTSVGPFSTFESVFSRGGVLAEVSFNECDGFGRPATLGNHEKRPPNQPLVSPISGPETTRCFDCHMLPLAGGSGGIAANTFNGAEDLHPVATDFEGFNERNTPGMFGSGAVELLAREMTADLQQQAADLRRRRDGWHVLTTKGVDFEVRTEGGRVVEARGIDIDLIVKPFGAGGTVVSLRQFTVDALNRHHGMQAEERFDLFLGDTDWDEDGVEREMTVGDVTALTIWQAALDMPLQVIRNEDLIEPAEQGEQLFTDVGCASCHVPEMTLDDRTYCEPNALNPPGYFNDVSQSVCFNLLADPRRASKQTPNIDGPMTVRMFSDFKRHNLCDDPGEPDAIRHFCNETLPEDRPDQDGRPGSEFFLTRRLWDVGESAPYGHRGDLPDLESAILAHGGEGRASRDAYAALPEEERDKVVWFLRTLAITNQNLRINPPPGGF